MWHLPGESNPAGLLQCNWFHVWKYATITYKHQAHMLQLLN